MDWECSNSTAYVKLPWFKCFTSDKNISQLANKNKNNNVPPPPIPPKILLDKDMPPPLPPKLQLFLTRESQEESNASLLADSFYGSSKVLNIYIYI